MAEIAVEAVLGACDSRGDVNFDLIKMKKKIGGTLSDTERF